MTRRLPQSKQTRHLILLREPYYGADSGSQIDVAVNAPEAGTIKEFLASEEDTVTVGQDLVRLEPGESKGGAKKADQEPKEPAPGDQKKSSDPQEKGAPSKDEQKPPPPEEKKAAPTPPSKDEKAPPPPRSETKVEDKSDQSKPVSSPFGAGSRDENRVR